MQDTKNTAPFLRWAGGKRWFTKYIDTFISKCDYVNYHEMFLGSGAVFFALSPSKNAYLSDLNQELIDTYSTIKTNPLEVIDELRTYINTKEFYYKIRNKNFENPIQMAARFIYLNQTSFNGIYRVNLKGEYNVPYGYRSKSFLDENLLLNASKALKNAKLVCTDFFDTKKNIKKGDLVFLDPPYTVSHNNNGFIKYNQTLFSLDDQVRLNEFIQYIKRKKAYFILTNAAHKTIKDIFDNGDKCIEVARASLIGGRKAKRGQVNEYVFTNIPGVNEDELRRKTGSR